MLKSPGQVKFKLKRLAEPIIDKATGMKYEFVCDELKNAPACTHCHAGFVYVAYGLAKGIWDIYKFPCKCSHTGGYEWWQTDDTRLHDGRPVEYQCKRQDMPSYVLIHPRHNAGQIEKLVKRIAQVKARIQAEESGEIPF